ncbi:MAG: hypothetical protein ACR2OH_09600 [Microthrixaceae bacterium]
MGATPELPIGIPTLCAATPAATVPEAIDVSMRGHVFPTIPLTIDPAGSLLAQASTAFEGVHPVGPGAIRVNTTEFGFSPDAATRLDAPAFDAFNGALAAWPSIAAESAPMAVRTEMVGPVSLALILAEAGLDLPAAMDAARVATVYRAEAIVAAVRKVEPSLPVAVVLDEHRLVGSMHPTFPLGVKQVRSLLDPAVDAIDVAAGASPVLIGIHVPGRSDWRTIISSGVSLVSMPADASVAGYAEWVQALLDNGGWIAWGAVPVDRPLGSSAELLWRHLVATWRDLEIAGVDGELLRQRSMVSPSDDLARFDMSQITMMVDLVDSLAGRISATAPRAPVSTGT